ncbi:MAG TPA: hypothetical protein VFC01_16445 [Mycobacterium sp.]|nr:hypothetical protein [Mycobacterium sp.]
MRRPVVVNDGDLDPSPQFAEDLAAQLAFAGFDGGTRCRGAGRLARSCQLRPYEDRRGRTAAARVHGFPLLAESSERADNGCA